MASTYCTISDIQNIFGIANTLAWSDIENTGSLNSTRNTQAIAVAGDRIDDVARVLNYKIPLADVSGSTPTSVTDIAATIAGIWLYNPRGLQDYDPKSGDYTHRLMLMERWYKEWLEDLRTQRIKIDAVKA